METGARKDDGRFREEMKGLNEDVRHEANRMADDLKRSGAQTFKTAADAAERLADDVSEQAPGVSSQIRGAAESLSEFSRQIETRSVGALLDQVMSFGRREPAAFVAASAVAGFALARLAKAAGAPSQPPQADPPSSRVAASSIADAPTAKPQSAGGPESGETSI